MSFAKIFSSIYDGTLVEHWQAMVTFQQMLILADAQGIVDMTPAAISRRTGIPAEVITSGLEVLERPDPASRSAEMEGRRIARLDAHREWGWFIVNHAEYRRRISAEEKREADRDRIAAKRSESRKVSQGVADCRAQSHELQPVAEVAQAEAEAEADISPSLRSGEARKRATPPPECPDDVPRETWRDWLTLRRAKKAPVTETVLRQARAEAAKAGLSLADFLAVWCARGSQGLQAEWLTPAERSRAGPAPPPTPKSRTLTAIETLQAMKSDGRVAERRNPEWPEPLALPQP